MPDVDLDAAPGYRRRIRIEPGEGSIRAAVEDDFHHMVVVLRHDGVTAKGVEPESPRAPWTTCPAAAEQLKATFSGAPLADFPARGEKRANCTHLYDMAMLAAAHAHDDAPTTYDILVSDEIDGRRMTEIRRDGVKLLGFSYAGHDIIAPPEIAGTRLDKLRPWIESLTPELQEAARLLQWGSMVAHGRSLPMDQQSDATKLPPNCYTFQPERSGRAVRTGKIFDFSAGGRQPLD